MSWFFIHVLFGITPFKLNVLISPEGRAVLTDFGFSRIANSSFSMPYLCGGGTLRWMAPEILDTGEATAAADVWAFGMTCLVSAYILNLPSMDIT